MSGTLTLADLIGDMHEVDCRISVYMNEHRFFRVHDDVSGQLLNWDDVNHLLATQRLEPPKFRLVNDDAVETIPEWTYVLFERLFDGGHHSIKELVQITMGSVCPTECKAFLKELLDGGYLHFTTAIPNSENSGGASMSAESQSNVLICDCQRCSAQGGCVGESPFFHVGQDLCRFSHNP